MKNKNERKKLSVQVIALAALGNDEAMQAIFDRYDGLISYILYQEIARWQLNTSLMPIEDMEQQVRVDLLKAIKGFTIRS